MSSATTLHQFTQLLLGQVVPVVLSRMAVVAEMSGAPAEPLSNGAAEFTFEFDEICPMCFALLDSAADGTRSTPTTNELLWVEFALCLVVVLT